MLITVLIKKYFASKLENFPLFTFLCYSSAVGIKIERRIDIYMTTIVKQSTNLLQKLRLDWQGERYQSPAYTGRCSYSVSRSWRHMCSGYWSQQGWRRFQFYWTVLTHRSQLINLKVKMIKTKNKGIESLEQNQMFKPQYL